MSEDELKDALTAQQYYVLRENGTERPFNNKYWDFKGEGIYVDPISGEPLFTSLDKFNSGTGWPSFTRPIDRSHVREVKDRTHGMVRIEVRSNLSDSHLGHVFPDGPGPEGLRYCINSAALRFVPVAKLDSAGLSQYKGLFKQNQ